MNDFWTRVTSMLTSDLRMTDISRITGIPRSTISNWIRRDTYPTVDLAEKIASALGVSVTWLVTGNNISRSKRQDVESKRVRKIINTLRELEEPQIEILEPVIEYIGQSAPPKKRIKK